MTKIEQANTILQTYRSQRAAAVGDRGAIRELIIKFKNDIAALGFLSVREATRMLEGFVVYPEITGNLEVRGACNNCGACCVKSRCKTYVAEQPCPSKTTDFYKDACENFPQVQDFIEGRVPNNCGYTLYCDNALVNPKDEDLS